MRLREDRAFPEQAANALDRPFADEPLARALSCPSTYERQDLTEFALTEFALCGGGDEASKDEQSRAQRERKQHNRRDDEYPETDQDDIRRRLHETVGMRSAT